MTSSTALALRDWIAETFHSNATWRENVAERFPDDARNTRSTDALYAAEAYVRALEDLEASPGLRRFYVFVEMLDDYGGGRWNTSPESLIHSGRRTGRFGFDVEGSDYEAALSCLYDDSVEHWAELLGESSDQPPGDVVRWFEGEGFPIWTGDDDA
jgi:hypothetical protein